MTVEEYTAWSAQWETYSYYAALENVSDPPPIQPHSTHLTATKGRRVRGRDAASGTYQLDILIGINDVPLVALLRE